MDAAATDINFGAYTVPVILTAVLALIYNVVNIGNKWKPLIATVIGIGLGILSIPYQGLSWEVKIIVDRVIYGMMTGFAAVGLWENYRKARDITRGGGST